MSQKVSQRARRLRQSEKAKEITKTILHIAAMGGLMFLVAGASRNPKAAPAAIKELAKFSKSRIKQCLKRLSLQNYIRYDENDLTQQVFLTSKGLQRYSVQSLKDKICACTMRKWDHIWRLVTFDVKETVRYKRDGFRKRLKTMNFFQLQKNIFVIPFKIEKELDELIRIYKMRNNALVMHVADLGKREGEVKNFFLKLARTNALH